MRDITYDSIQMLVDSAEVRGRAIWCVFSCPVTGAKVESVGVIPDEVTAEQREKLQDLGLYGQVRSALASVFWDIVGTGPKAAGEGGSGGADRDGSTDVHEDLRRAGIIDAFRRVSHRFVFDPEVREWLSASAAEQLLTPFGVQLNEAPVEKPRDVEVTARMLVEIARADGVLGEREREMLTELVGGEERVAELAETPTLSDGDFADVSEGEVRRTMLMLAWAAAFTDEQLADVEKVALSRFAEALGIIGGEEDAVRLLARDYVIDTVFDHAWANLEVEPGERRHVVDLALALGASEEDVARIEEAYRKRMGYSEPPDA